MTYTVAMTEGFASELGRVPKKVQNAMKRVFAELRDHPDTPNPPRIKRLKEYKGLWRYRIADSYRLVYRVEGGGRTPTITLLMLDDRKRIYSRLGAGEDGTPGIEVIAGGLDGLLEKNPTPEEVGRAVIEVAAKGVAVGHAPDERLPSALTAQLLSSWGIPEKYHAALASVITEGELLGLSDRIPGKTLERVMSGIWPPSIEEVVQEPIRIADDADSLIDVADGNRSLASFLLRLDDDQAAFASRFDREEPQGPWLLKGGPGSGKSVVALYCIRELIDREEAKLPNQRRRLRILLTTYTNSLVNASQELLRSLRRGGDDHDIRVATIDRVVRDFLPESFRDLTPLNESKAKAMAFEALACCRRRDPAFSFERDDASYLLEEVDWVVVGQNMTNRDEYADEADRTGRKRGLTKAQRQHVWDFYEEFRSVLRSRDFCLFSERQQAALNNASETYDYVFIDEAQDLKPVGVRFGVAIAKPNTNVFITADSNQSIYGTGMAWSRIAQDLRVTGRTRILRRNYRTTTEIWNGVSQLSPDAEDAETLDIEAVYSGPFPILARYTTATQWHSRLNQFLFASMAQERVGPDSAAVLCPTRAVMEDVASALDESLNAKMMVARDLAIGHPGVKITTMHAAKGLEFPIVAVVGADEGLLPWPAPVGIDPADHIARQHRLLFVAGTRAMRQLMIVTSTTNPSPFLAAVTDDYWEIEAL